MTLKQKLHERIESLSESELEWLNTMLERHNAEIPEEDEEISASEAEAIREGLAEIARGETVSAEEVQRQLNLPALFPIDKHSRMG
jgi:predicted transcriptional regulator